MDMARTTVNLVGNCLATVVMARWEGEFTPGVSQTPVAGELPQGMESPEPQEVALV